MHHCKHIQTHERLHWQTWQSKHDVKILKRSIHSDLKADLYGVFKNAKFAVHYTRVLYNKLCTMEEKGEESKQQYF